MLYPTTCVGLRYGPTVCFAFRGFSRKSASRHSKLPEGTSLLVPLQLNVWICLYVSAPLRFCTLFRQRAAVPLLRHPVTIRPGCVVLYACPSVSALRPALRSRLTLIRLALIRNPWSFGGGVSRSPYRYLFPHLLFRWLQNPSRDSFCALRNAPLPIPP